MHKTNKTFYLPIRAFGDFLISAKVVKNRFAEKIPVLLPEYLFEIFSAINAGEYFEIINKIPFNNQPIFFQFYTLKNADAAVQLLKDIITMKSIVNKNDNYILDYSSKRLFYTQANFFWPGKEKNLYTGKLEIFSRFFKTKHCQEKFIDPFKLLPSSKILIIPDSRIKIKEINHLLIETIKSHFNNFQIDVAHFSKNDHEKNGLSYSSFKELVELINIYDFIISAESLPYHLSNYLDKPHFVIYNDSRHNKTTFMTPYMIQNKSYLNFKNNDFLPAIKEIENILFCNS